MEIDRSIDLVVEWARDDENIRLMVLTGSAARGSDRTDALSDLDIEVYTRHPQALLQDRSWHDRFGELLVREELPNVGRNPTRLLYYVDGKIDFTIIDVADVGLVSHDRAVRVLLDRDGLGPDISVKTAPSDLPEPAAVEECVNWFYAAALMEAKQLVRGELWQAKLREWDLLPQLLRMIGWNHKVRYRTNYDTWFNGKHYGKWMDSDVRLRARHVGHASTAGRCGPPSSTPSNYSLRSNRQWRTP